MPALCTNYSHHSVTSPCSPTCPLQPQIESSFIKKYKLLINAMLQHPFRKLLPACFCWRGELRLAGASSIFFMVISCPLSILATEFMQTWGFWGSSNLSASLIWFNVEVGLSSAILVTHWVISTSHLTLKLPPRCLATSSNNGPRGCTLDTHLFCRLLIVFISLKSSGKSFFVHSWNLGSRHLESITECVCRNRLAIFIRARVSCKHCGLRVPTSLFNRQTTWLCR